jgi:hypothetical protein
MHVVVVEPGFAHGDDFRGGEQLQDTPSGVVRPMAGFVWVHTNRRGPSRGAARERHRALAAGQRLSDHHDVGDSRGFRVGQHGVAVDIERGIAEVAVRVD